MSKKILVVAAHADDEVLGCGATVAKHSSDGDTVHVLILAEGITSRDEKRDPEKRALELAQLVKTANKANKALGVDFVTMLDFPDNRMDSADFLDIVKRIEKYMNEFQPETVYTHFNGDLNIDHRLTSEAVVTACRPFPGQTVKCIMFFEVASSTEWQANGSANIFNPNIYVDVTATVSHKTNALKIYSSEMRDWPHARSVEALEHLAKWRGSSVGVEAAEAFMLGRMLR